MFSTDGVHSPPPSPLLPPLQPPLLLSNLSGPHGNTPCAHQSTSVQTTAVLLLLLLLLLSRLPAGCVGHNKSAGRASVAALGRCYRHRRRTPECGGVCGGRDTGQASMDASTQRQPTSPLRLWLLLLSPLPLLLWPLPLLLCCRYVRAAGPCAVCIRVYVSGCAACVHMCCACPCVYAGASERPIGT